MNSRHFITGIGKLCLYIRIILHIPCYYVARPRLFATPWFFIMFLRKALLLLLVFRHNKVVRVFNGYKLHLYLPAYPSRAFFYAIESKLLRTPPGPTTLVFSMTKACTYRCLHCYQKRDSADEIAEDLMIRTALAARDAGVAMLDIEGGEPFLRFARLLDLVRAMDDRCEVWVNTSGAHIKPGMIEELKKAGLFGLMVSIHSPDRERHDLFTGIPGSFDAACDAIRLCRKMNLVAACNSVLSEQEIRNGDLDKLMSLSRELDCDYVQLIHPKPAGIWIGRKEEMQTDPALIESIQRAHVRYNSRAMHSYPSLAAQVFEERSDVLGCTSGAVDRFYVGASGEVQPCEFLNLSFGNVKEDPFEDILVRMRSFFRVPCCDWLCCTQAEAIAKLFEKHNLKQTPLPWSMTRELVENWNRGRPTPIYERLGIYK